MDGWKKILFRAAGFGIGFALLSAIIIGSALWWSSRPVKPKPWNTKAITATFDTLNTEGETNTLEFVYTLENNTDVDYRASDGNQIHLASNLVSQHSLSFDTQNFITTDYPIYIPAKSRVRFELHLAYPYPIKQDVNARPDIRYDYTTVLAQFVDKTFRNLDGFVLLDDNARYQVMMPNGWAERAKEPLRIRESAVIPRLKP